MKMGDFSQPSDVYRRNSKVDLASALRESISFGRFFSESLDWEKWSAFSHNKHLEEAKNCSVPGSVAQKKAFFEAHYRRSAALKLAAQLKPINDNRNLGFSYTKAENVEPELDESSCMKAEGEEQRDQRCLKTPYKFGEKHGLEKMDGDNGGSAIGVGFHGKNSLQIKGSNIVENNENEAITYDSDCMKQDKKAMKEVSSLNHQNECQNKKKSVTNTIKSIDFHEESRISSASASKIQKSISKENKPPHNHMVDSLRLSERRKPALGSPHRPIGSNSIQRGQKPFIANKTSSFYEKVGDSNISCISSRPSEFHHSHIKTPSKVSTCGPKHTFSTPQLEYKRTQTPLYETSSTRRKVHAKFCPLSINCFKSPSERESRQLPDRSVSSSSKTIKKISVTKPAESPNFARINSKSSAETPLLRSSCKRNKTRQMNV